MTTPTTPRENEFDSQGLTLPNAKPPRHVEAVAAMESFLGLVERRTGHPGFDDSAAPSPLPSSVPGYEILAEQGRGGMGVVYQARHLKLNRLVALKMILAGDYAGPEQLARFRVEAETLAQLRHPNVVQIYEVGEADGKPYLALEFLEGGSLDKRLRGTPTSPREAAQLVEVLARAMQAAHQSQIVHRDLKPANVLLTADGIPKITDFGLAKRLDEAGQTHSGAVMGTPSYLAPEQASGQSKEVGPAADVYALGAILYECLTGRPPFKAATGVDTILQVINEEPIAPRRLQPAIPRDLETICRTCLAKDPRRRYASALALADDLNNWLEDRPIAARPATPRERLVKWVRRRPAQALLACLSVIVLVATLVGSLWHVRVLNDALTDSNQLRQKGLEREARLRDLLYVADVRRAKEAWDGGDLPHLAELLERQRPAAGEPDRRGFEWYWLKWCLGTRLGTLKAHDGGLLCAAVSPDDRFLVTGDRKGAVKVWDLASLRQVATLAGHTNEVQRAVFSPDGRTLATCSTDRSVRLWDVSTWTERARLLGHSMSVTSVAFSPDGKLLASASRDQRIALWQQPGGQAVRSWQAHSDVIHDLAFLPDGALVSVGSDRFANRWDAAAATETGRWRVDAEALSLALSPDGKTLASGGYGSWVSLFNKAVPGKPTVALPVSWTVRALAFAPSGSRLFAACDSGMLSVWDVAPDGRDARPPRILRRGGGKGRAAVFARHGTLLVTASEEEGTVEFWDPERLDGYETMPSLPRSVNEVAWLPDGRAITANEENWCLLDLKDRRIERTFPSLPGALEVAISADGRTMAAVCGEPQARLWDVASGRVVLSLDHGATVKEVAFSPTGEIVATAGIHGKVRLWDFPSGALRATCTAGSNQANCLAFTTDGRTLAVGITAQLATVTLWDPVTGALQGEVTDPGSTSTPPPSSPAAPSLDEPSLRIDRLAFSPDGSLLAAACSDEVIRVWDVGSRKLRLTLSGHVGGVRNVAFTPDGRTLASLGDDHALNLWHLGTGQRLFTLASDANGFYGLAFGRDGRTLVAGVRSRNGLGPSSLRLWRAEPAE